MEEKLMDYLFVYDIKYNRKCRGIYKICPICGKLFFVPLTILKSGKGNYCSNECFFKSQERRIKRICKTCGKSFEITMSAFKKGEGKYCSKECFYADSVKVERKCKKCGKTFYVYPSEITKGNGLFCSVDCRAKYYSGERNNKWTGGGKEYICIMCGKKFINPPSKEKQGRAKFCCNECAIKYRSKYYVGENASNWKGGITPVVNAYRTSTKYSNWRISCMARDNFTCQKCGAKGVMLNVHHIKSVKEIFNEYNIKMRDDYMNCKELWDLNNGITLCEECHKEIHFGKM